MRHSDQRDIVYSAVCNLNHPSVEEILAYSKELMPSINIATVYRNLTVLVEQKKVQRLFLDDKDHFDKTIHPHPHFYCKECDSVTDIDNMDLSSTIINLENKGFSVEKTDVMFTGICSKCKIKKGD